MKLVFTCTKYDFCVCLQHKKFFNCYPSFFSFFPSFLVFWTDSQKFFKYFPSVVLVDMSDHDRESFSGHIGYLLVLPGITRYLKRDPTNIVYRSNVLYTPGNLCVHNPSVATTHWRADTLNYAYKRCHLRYLRQY